MATRILFNDWGLWWVVCWSLDHKVDRESMKFEIKGSGPFYAVDRYPHRRLPSCCEQALAQPHFDGFASTVCRADYTNNVYK